jgi:hypothetical protein
VQRAAGHRSLLTLVVTPTESTLDDEPAVSDSKADANQTDSITYDDIDERVYDEGTVITNKLYTDINDL